MTLHCPLCDTAGPDSQPHFHRDSRREYVRCAECALVYVPPAYFLTREEERACYELHENAVDDPGYRRFLSRLASPLMERLPPHARGLDFGCGPAPALAAMLREAGHEVALYDSFFFPERVALAQRYEFVTATEVVEHLHRPGEVLAKLWECIEPGGWLGVMTKLVRDAEAFASWHYIRDPTHVCFFSRETWSWWAQRHAAELTTLGADVMLLRKSGDAT